MPTDRAVVVELASVRAEPDETSEQVTQVLRGERVEVEKLEGDWARIRTAYDYPGWIRAGSLGNAPGPGVPCAPKHNQLDAAREYLGAPYEWGGMTTGGVDCSGLVHMAYRATGRLVPRDAHEQEAAAEAVSKDAAQPGDLVCFGEPGAAIHIAFWLGEGRILHATSRENLGVVEEPLENVGEELVRFVRL